jgi:hypothetical protein
MFFLVLRGGLAWLDGLSSRTASDGLARLDRLSSRTASDGLSRR